MRMMLIVVVVGVVGIDIAIYNSILAESISRAMTRRHYNIVVMVVQMSLLCSRVKTSRMTRVIMVMFTHLTIIFRELVDVMVSSGWIS